MNGGGRIRAAGSAFWRSPVSWRGIPSSDRTSWPSDSHAGMTTESDRSVWLLAGVRPRAVGRFRHDRQRGWLELGYSGLFTFLNRELRLSQSAAFSRMTAAGLIQRYPDIVEPLRDGRLCLSTMGSLAKVLTPANCAEVLPRFFYLSGLEAKALVAELAPVPNPPTRTVVTVTPARVAPTAVVPRMTEDRGSSDEPLCLEGTGPVTAPIQAPLRAAPAPRIEVEPLTPTVTRIHMSISPAFLEKLESARPALSHSMPGADAEDILTAGPSTGSGRSLDLLLARDAKRKGLVSKPRSAAADAPVVPGADYVPAAVRREVWERDEGRCQWPLEGGGICGSELRGELDHVQPRCRGGKPTTEGLRVLC